MLAVAAGILIALVTVYAVIGAGLVLLRYGAAILIGLVLIALVLWLMQPGALFGVASLAAVVAGFIAFTRWRIRVEARKRAQEAASAAA